MPELPDIVAYLQALQTRVVGHPLSRIRLASPFLLRSVDPPVEAVDGKTVRGLRRIGKRIVFEFGGDLYAVLHLMIAGRLHWADKGAKINALTYAQLLQWAKNMKNQTGQARFGMPVGTNGLINRYKKLRR